MIGIDVPHVRQQRDFLASNVFCFCQHDLEHTVRRLPDPGGWTIAAPQIQGLQGASPSHIRVEAIRCWSNQFVGQARLGVPPPSRADYFLAAFHPCSGSKGHPLASHPFTTSRPLSER